MDKLDKLVMEIGSLKLDELRELEKRLGSLGGESLGVLAPLTPKINPPTLSQRQELEVKEE